MSMIFDEDSSREIEIYELKQFKLAKLKSQLVTCGETAPATDAKHIPGQIGAQAQDIKDPKKVVKINKERRQIKRMKISKKVYQKMSPLITSTATVKKSPFVRYILVIPVVVAATKKCPYRK